MQVKAADSMTLLIAVLMAFLLWSVLEIIRTKGYPAGNNPPASTSRTIIEAGLTPVRITNTNRSCHVVLDTPAASGNDDHPPISLERTESDTGSAILAGYAGPGRGDPPLICDLAHGVDLRIVPFGEVFMTNGFLVLSVGIPEGLTRPAIGGLEPNRGPADPLQSPAMTAYGGGTRQVPEPSVALLLCAWLAGILLWKKCKKSFDGDRIRVARPFITLDRCPQPASRKRES